MIHALSGHVCESNPRLTQAAPLPQCLFQNHAIRYQVFGCDFEVDRPLSGLQTRLHECNCGPDFSPHSPLDRNLKRDVAADYLSFVALSGAADFDDTAERRERFNIDKVYDSTDFDEQSHLDMVKEALKERDKDEL